MHSTQDAATRNALEHAYTTSISMIWLINTPILGVGLILGAQYINLCRLFETLTLTRALPYPSLPTLINHCALTARNQRPKSSSSSVCFLRPYTLKRHVVKSQGPKQPDPEAGLADEKAGVIASADAPQLSGAPTAEVSDSVVEKEKDTDDVVPRRSTSKSRTSTRTNAGDDVDAGTIAGEPDIPKE